MNNEYSLNIKRIRPAFTRFPSSIIITCGAVGYEVWEQQIDHQSRELNERHVS